MAADQELQELVQDFVTESRDHLAHVESDLLNLEATPAEGEGTIHRVFRAVHSVKGVAGFLGLETINRLAHTLESVLDLMRKDQLAPSAELVSVLLGATDRLRDLIEHVSDSNQMAIDEHLARLQAYQGGSPRAAGAAAPTTPTAAAAPAVMPAAASEPLQPGERLLECNLSLPALALHTGRPAAQLPDVVAGFGRVVVGAASLCSAAGETPLPSRPVTLRLAVTRPTAEVAAALGLELGELHEIAAAPAGREPAAATPPAAPPAPSRAAAAEPAAKADPKTKRAEPAAGEGSESIRVAVPLLDRLMNLSGELVLGRNQLLQARSTGNDKQAGVAAARLNQVVSEIQEAVMQTRMQPVGTLFQRFPRVVRDLAGKLGKRCTLELEGRDVDLDRSILEALSDPLTHLVRNSIDHGLEKPDERRAAGKPEDGRLTLRAVQQGGNVRLTVGDDGRGIDPARLRRKAVEKGVITEAQAQALSDREAVHLIFAPGFSTAEKVTDVSGRGVGMDVVRSNIERIGGSVEVQSAVGRGTTIAITIPLTLAILPAMVLENGAQRYVLPQANVAELVRIRDEELAERLVELDGREVLRLRGRLLPLLRLR